MSPPDLAILQRKLERERAAREEAEDIAERTTRQLYEVGQRMELILRGAGDGICGVDGAGLTAFLNPAGAKMLGLRPEDAVGKPFHDVVHPTAAKKELCTDQCSVLASIAQGARKEASIECLYQRLDGSRFPTECIVNSLPSERGGAVFVFRDMSERKKGEEARRIAVERLMEIERLKGMDQFKTRFINIAAHEPNTPITPLKLQLHLLRTGYPGPLNEKQAKAIGIVERNLDRLAALVQDLLDVARIEEKRLTLKREHVYLDSLLSEAVEAFRPQAVDQRIELALATAADVWIDVDPRRITQVLFNLVSNAFKVTPEGGRVTLESAVAGSEVQVRVRDTGVGLAAEQITQLFQAFSQAHDHLERTRSAAGLGLYISKAIVEQHGGKIGCESPGPGKGATFVFSIPLSV